MCRAFKQQKSHTATFIEPFKLWDLKSSINLASVEKKSQKTNRNQNIDENDIFRLMKKIIIF